MCSMIPVSTGISINSHRYLGSDATGTTGITTVIFLECLPYVSTGIKSKKYFIPTGIYEKVISTLEDPRVWNTHREKFPRSARANAIPVRDSRG